MLDTDPRLSGLSRRRVCEFGVRIWRGGGGDFPEDRLLLYDDVVAAAAAGLVVPAASRAASFNSTNSMISCIGFLSMPAAPRILRLMSES